MKGNRYLTLTVLECSVLDSLDSRFMALFLTTTITSVR